jgi:hypothetical protein
MERPKSILIALMVAAVPAWAQNATSPGEQASANSTQQAEVAGPNDNSRLVLARNPDEATAIPDAGLEPVGSPVSPALASELAVGAPRYGLPDAAKAAETDKPKNEIPRLPESTLSRFVVHGSRVNGFSDHDMLTDDGLVDLSFGEHPGMRFGNILKLNAPAAFEAFKAEERLSKIADLNDTAMAMQAGGDSSEARLIQAEAAQAYMRTEDQQGPVGIK